VDFTQDYYLPFAKRFATSIQQVLPDAMIFLESEQGLNHPTWPAITIKNAVFAPHWYDAMVLVLKDFHPWIGFDTHAAKLVFGPRRIRRSFAAQLRRFKDVAAQQMGEIPTLIGEFGIAFDLREGKAYKTNDYRLQEAALERSFRAIEDNLLSCTLWNYTADNDNEHGDQWNGEDLSIFSLDQQLHPKDLNSGGRALDAAVRPYPIATAGEPLELSFNSRTRIFSFRFRHDPHVNAPTEIFLPRFHYPQPVSIHVSDGHCSYDSTSQKATYVHDPSFAEHTITVKP
jgi:hypothetical protein